MAHDWGHVFRTAAGAIFTPDPFGILGFGDEPAPVANVPQTLPGTPPITPVTGGLGAESCEGMVWSGGTPPKGFKVVNYCGRGVLRKIRRRRRRRLLTASDKADIAAIVGLVGKGQMASSLITRVGT